MAKNEKEVLVDGHKMKVILGDPKKEAEQIRMGIKRRDKLNSMRMSLTYIESQQMEATPEQAIEFADRFLAWLEK